MPTDVAPAEALRSYLVRRGSSVKMSSGAVAR